MTQTIHLRHPDSPAIARCATLLPLGTPAASTLHELRRWSEPGVEPCAGCVEAAEDAERRAGERWHFEPIGYIIAAWR